MSPDDKNRDYYVKRRRPILWAYGWFAKRIRKSLEARYDAEFADAVMAETRQGFEAILPQSPYIGGMKNYFTPIILINAGIIALHRAMKAHGQSTEDTIRICCEVSDGLFTPIPGFLLRFIGRQMLGPISIWTLKRQAARSQKRAYPEDFVYAVVKGDGADFDWALELSECAVNKFYDAQDVPELKPYCNFFDATYSRHMNMGLNANQTIGLGCATCAMRFKKGGQTQIPPRLQGILPGTEAPVE